MARVLAALIAVVTGTWFLAPASCRAQSSQAKVQAGSFSLKVTPGPEYRVLRTAFLFIKIPSYPQFACWIETPDREYVRTIYVTPYAASARARPETLPVWRHAARELPKRSVGLIEATPASGVNHTTPLAELPAPGRYVVLLEANRSYDYNDAHPRASSTFANRPMGSFSSALLRSSSGWYRQGSRRE